MGIYYNKLVESAASIDPETVIQTPDDVGNDLDAIEKAVEAEHKEGDLDGGCFCTGEDCVEEATMIVFESEYNMGQLMKRIGLTELHEYTEGRDFVLEGANFKAFCERVIANLKKLFSGLVSLFQKGVAAIKEAANVDKQLLKQEAKMAEGCKNETWKVKSYDLAALDVKNNSAVKLSIFAPGKDTLSIEKLVSYNGANVVDMKRHEAELSHAECVKRVAGVEAEDGTGMVAKLKEAIFVEKEYDYSTGGVFELVVDALSKSDDINALKEAYTNIKAKYDALIKEIKTLEKGLDDKTDSAAATKALQAVTFEKGLQNQCYSVCLKAYRTRRSVARRMASNWIRLAPKAEKPKAKNEGARLFDFDLM